MLAVIVHDPPAWTILRRVLLDGVRWRRRSRSLDDVGDPARHRGLVLGSRPGPARSSADSSCSRPGGLLQGRRDAWLGSSRRSAGRCGSRCSARSRCCAMVSVIARSAFLLGFDRVRHPGASGCRSCGRLCDRRAAVRAARAGQGAGRSSSSSSGRFWAIFLLLIVTTLLTFSSPRSSRASRRPRRRLRASDNDDRHRDRHRSSARSCSAMVTYPYLAAVLTILYFDQRVRKEGFDLQLLARGHRRRARPGRPAPAPLRRTRTRAAAGAAAPRAAAGPGPPPPGWQPPAAAVRRRLERARADAPPLRWGPAAGAPQDEPARRVAVDGPRAARERWLGTSGRSAPTDHRRGPALRARRRRSGARRPRPRRRLADGARGGARARWRRRAARARPTTPRRDAARTTPRRDVAGARPRRGRPPRWRASPVGESPWDDKPDEDDTRRSARDWQPPERPRGPGGREARPRAGVVLVAGGVPRARAPRHATEVSRGRVPRARPARRATRRSALAELRDGRRPSTGSAVDIDAALRGARGEALDARLRRSPAARERAELARPAGRRARDPRRRIASTDRGARAVPRPDPTG